MRTIAAILMLTVASALAWEDDLSDLLQVAVFQSSGQPPMTPYDLGTPLVYFDFSEAGVMLDTNGAAITASGVGAQRLDCMATTNIWWRANTADPTSLTNGINGRTVLNFTGANMSFTNARAPYYVTNLVQFFVFRRATSNIQSRAFNSSGIANGYLPSWYDASGLRAWNYYGGAGGVITSATLGATGVFYAASITTRTNAIMLVNGSPVTMGGSTVMSTFNVQAFGGAGANNHRGHMACAILWDNTAGAITAADLGRLYTNWALPRWGNP